MISLETEVLGAILSAAASFIVLILAYRKGFFAGWRGNAKPSAPPPFLLVIIAFTIYFAVGLIFPQLLSRFLIVSDLNERIEHAAWITFLTGGCTLVCLIGFTLTIYRPIRENLWHRSSEIFWKKDFQIALAACLISFPIVIFSSQLLEIFVYLVFHTFDLPDQLVILFLKMTFDKPFYFVLATLSIIVFAPMIEEMLFRGFLQSYLRRYMSAPLAILAASACFALFHYSKEQGLGNIPIVGSLFVLANFLGFVYERQGSLAAPVILHAIFNGLSIANLYFLGV